MTKDFTPEWIIVHCSATPPEMTEVDAAWIDRVHRRKGWLGAGYHAIVTRTQAGQPPVLHDHAGGYPMRPIDRPGAHVGGCGAEWNRKTLGICYAGGVDSSNVPEDNLTRQQAVLLLGRIREWQAEYGIPDERVIGHRDLIRMTNSAPKACPCLSTQALVNGTRFGGDFKFTRKINGGDILSIPETHRVRRAESLWGISQAYSVTVEQLREWNGIKDDMIRIGSVLSLRPAQ